MQKRPTKAHVPVSAHLLSGTSLASPKKNSECYQDHNCILTFIVWVAKGHRVLIVQKQDGSNVLTARAPVTSLLIQGRGRSVQPSLWADGGRPPSSLEGRSPVPCRGLVLSSRSHGAVLSHNLTDSDMKKVL